MWLLALLLTLTYCQSSQVTEMLIAVKEQFVSMKLQLKYYWAAILDWQCSERMLNSQHLPLAEPAIWLAAKWNTFAHVGYLVKRHLQPSVPIMNMLRAMASQGWFLEGELATYLQWLLFAVAREVRSTLCWRICACLLEGTFSSSDWFCGEWTATRRLWANRAAGPDMLQLCKQGHSVS